MHGILAHRTEALLQPGRSDDGQFGLIGFRRERSETSGDDAIWIAVPTGLLPRLAVVAFMAIPQPELGSYQVRVRGTATGAFSLVAMVIGVQSTAVLGTSADESARLLSDLRPTSTARLMRSMAPRTSPDRYST